MGYDLSSYPAQTTSSKFYKLLSCKSFSMIENTFKRSWEITKLTFHVMKEDKELILYPILAGIFSLMFILALLVPTIIVAVFEQAGVPAFGIIEYILLFIVYFGLAFIATFFNTCVVYTAKKRFEGGNATPGETFKFAFSKIHLIAMWSALAATVGLLLRVLENMARKAKGLGGVLLHILRSVLGLAWSLVTIFVVPAMVYHDLTPFDAIKKSISVLKKTWGESLVRYLGLGMVQGLVTFLVLIPIIILSIGFFVTGAFIAVAVMILLAIIWVTMVTMVFNIANSIFNTALYEYASSGNVPGGYTKDMMEHAFKNTKK